EVLDQVTKSAAQHTPHTRTAQEPAEIAKHAALTTSLLIVLAGSAGRRWLQPAEDFGDFVPVLITRDSEQSQKCNHCWHSAGYFILLCVLRGTYQRHRTSSGTKVLFPPNEYGVYRCVAARAVAEPLIGAGH